MSCRPITTYYFEKKFKKLTKSDGLLKERIIKKLQEIVGNPEIGDPKRHALKGFRSVHLDPFVLVYCTFQLFDVFIVFSNYIWPKRSY
jgi:mRNA-degrading endonuclease RelE of RelBE toxin-antitoxin system